MGPRSLTVVDEALARLSGRGCPGLGLQEANHHHCLQVSLGCVLGVGPGTRPLGFIHSRAEPGVGVPRLMQEQRPHRVWSSGSQSAALGALGVCDHQVDESKAGAAAA